MSSREYEGAGINVHWDSSRCFHSGRCVSGGPAVFDNNARPWVNLEGASAAEVACVIDSCPSGALSYTRTDGAPNGRRGRAAGEDPTASVAADGESGVSNSVAAATMVTITPRYNGPLSVRGPVGLVRPDGEVELLDHAVLCRCGHSADKPFCDGTHARCGFVAPGVRASRRQ